MSKTPPDPLRHDPLPLLPIPDREPSPPSGWRWFGHALLILGTGIILVVVLGMVSSLIGALLAPAVGLILLVGGLMILVISGASLAKYCFEQSVALLQYLAAAVRLNLPLADYMDQVARGESGRLSSQARAVADRLRNGYSLGETLLAVRTEIPRSDCALVWRGEACGRMGDALARIEHALARRRQQSVASNQPFSVTGYVVLVTAAIIIMTSAVGIYIIPKFREIVYDFDTQLPWITQVTFDWLAIFAAPAGLIAHLIVVWLVGWSVYRWVSGSRGVSDPIFRFFEPLYWRLPLISGGYRSRALADSCFLIEQAMRAGQPLPDAVENAATPAASRVMHLRLSRFAKAMREGDAPDQAARRAKLPGMIVGMLATAQHSDDPGSTFTYLTRYYDTKINPFETAMRAALLPIATLILAGLTGWIVLAIFYPLILLLEEVNQQSGLY